MPVPQNLRSRHFHFELEHFQKHVDRRKDMLVQTVFLLKCIKGNSRQKSRAHQTIATAASRTEIPGYFSKKPLFGNHHFSDEHGTSFCKICQLLGKARVFCCCSPASLINSSIGDMLLEYIKRGKMHHFMVLSNVQGVLCCYL